MSATTGHDMRVLIVDDDFYVATLHAGYVNAVPGFAALAPVHDARLVAGVVADLQPDLVLLDVYLPQGSGLDLLRVLDVDVMMLSAAAETATVRTALRRGALAYLVKPFEPKVLASRLRAYARYRRLLDGVPALDQGAIDRAQRMMLSVEEPVSSTSGASTEAAVLDVVARSGNELTVVDVAQEVGIARATAQRYLAALVQGGRLDLNLRYGARGRPEHRYSLPR